MRYPSQSTLLASEENLNASTIKQFRQLFERLNEIDFGSPTTYNDIAIDASSKYLAAAGKDRRIHVFDLEAGQRIAIISGHVDSVRAVAWQPSADRLASCSDDGTIRIWESKTWRQQLVLSEHEGPVLDIKWNPAGTKLASCGEDGTIIIRDATLGLSRTQVDVQRGQTPDLIRAVAADDLRLPAIIDERLQKTDSNRLAMAMQSAAQLGQSATIQRISKLGRVLDQQTGSQALIDATRCHHSETVAALLTTNVDVDVTDMHGETTLHHASRDGNLTVVERLIAAKATVDVTTKDGRTPLMLAAFAGHTDVLTALLSAGADPNTQDSHSRTALMYAILSESPDCIVQLRQAGASLTVADADGKTAIAHAVARGRDQIIRVLHDGEDTPGLVALYFGLIAYQDRDFSKAAEWFLKGINDFDETENNEASVRGNQSGWRVVTGERSWYIVEPLLTMQLLLADCYFKGGEIDKNREWLKRIDRNWPKYRTFKSRKRDYVKGKLVNSKVQTVFLLQSERVDSRWPTARGQSESVSRYGFHREQIINSLVDETPLWISANTSSFGSMETIAPLDDLIVHSLEKPKRFSRIVSPDSRFVLEIRFPNIRSSQRIGTERLLQLTPKGYVEVRKTTVKEHYRARRKIVSTTGRIAKSLPLSRKRLSNAAIEIYGIDRRLQSSISSETALRWIESNSLPKSPEIQLDDFDTEALLSLLNDRIYEAKAFTPPKQERN